jgi:regulator of cell morphogenesis and NO signaling
MNNLMTKTVREIALEAPGTTRVFEEFKIDYCCGGRQPLEEACAKVGADLAEVVKKLGNVPAENGSAKSWQDASLSDLVDHIIDTHHVFTKSELVNLQPLMEKVARVHGDHHPELLELKEEFENLAASLLPHMGKEEKMLFPYIRDMEFRAEKGWEPKMPPFGTVRHPVKMMMMEHDTDGDTLKRMRRLSNDYTTPPDACPSFTGLYHRLAELERDLHQHIHLENNVLFPRSVELEERAVEAMA